MASVEGPVRDEGEPSNPRRTSATGHVWTAPPGQSEKNSERGMFATPPSFSLLRLLRAADGRQRNASNLGSWASALTSVALHECRELRPLIRLRLRRARSSAGRALSLRFSISRAASSEAVATLDRYRIASVGGSFVSTHLLSPEMKVLLPSLIGSIVAFQFTEDDRRQDGKSAKEKKGLVQTVYHLARI